MKQQKTKKLTVLSMLCAMAYVTTFVFHFLGISFIPVLSFLSYDPKDIIIVIGGFLYGPLASVAVSVVVSFLEFLTISKTGLIGLAMNILSSCAFALPAALIYKRKHSLKGAILGLCAGVGAMVAVMLAWNYILTPLYMTGVTREQIAQLLIPAFLPFNLIKGCLNATATALLYRPLVQALRSAGLFPKSTEGKTMEKSTQIRFYLITAVLLLFTLGAVFYFSFK